MTEIRNSILAGLAFGFLNALFFAVWFDAHYALIAGPISGLAFGMVLYFFLTSKTVKKQTQIENLDSKPIIRSGGANHFINGEAVGGKLYLLKDKLQFQSHGFNIQNHGQIIDHEQIKEVSFYNTLGIIPNGLTIITRSGQTEKFVVNGRRHWKEEIEKLQVNSR
ncbi:MAG: hypothetical protein H0W73_20130 [Bacteroidetes bacterium]|nr:hypothetical protein [Bacteroidota bacterium]